MPVPSSPPAENTPPHSQILPAHHAIRPSRCLDLPRLGQRASQRRDDVGACRYMYPCTLPCFTLAVGTLFTACIRPSTLASQQLDSALPSSFRLPSIQYSRNIQIITLGTYLIMSKFESYQVGTYRTECCTTRSRYAAQCLALCCQQYQYIPYISQSDAAFSFHTSHELANSSVS